MSVGSAGGYPEAGRAAAANGSVMLRVHCVQLFGEAQAHPLGKVEDLLYEGEVSCGGSCQSPLSEALAKNRATILALLSWDPGVSLSWGREPIGGLSGSSGLNSGWRPLVDCRLRGQMSLVDATIGEAEHRPPRTGHSQLKPG